MTAEGFSFICPTCKVRTVVDQPEPFHAGWNDEGFLYCEKCPEIVVFSSYDPFYSALVGSKQPWVLAQNEKRAVEEHIRLSSCGGRFRFGAQPRCPHCNEPLSGILPTSLHYLAIGSKIEGAAVWTNMVKPEASTSQEPKRRPLRTIAIALLLLTAAPFAGLLLHRLAGFFLLFLGVLLMVRRWRQRWRNTGAADVFGLRSRGGSH